MVPPVQNGTIGHLDAVVLECERTAMPRRATSSPSSPGVVSNESTPRRVISNESTPRKRTTVALPVELHKQAKRRAIDDDCDLSDVVQAALIAYLD